jgi:hypothetical protein
MSPEAIFWLIHALPFAAFFVCVVYDAWTFGD